MKSLLWEVQTEEVLQILNGYILEEETIIVWQLISSNERKVDVVKLNKIDDQYNLSFLQNNSAQIQFSIGTLYCFVPKKSTIFKFKLNEIQENLLLAEPPLEIKLLDENETGILDQKYDYKKNKPDFYLVKGKKDKKSNEPDLMRVKSISKHDMDLFNEELGAITLEEEEKKFASSRETPRARPKKDKIVNIKRKSDQEGKSYLLFDLSQGGLSFIVNIEDEFNKGDEIQIIGFDLKVFDEPMIGQIMSIRPLDEMGFQNKVGIKFIS